MREPSARPVVGVEQEADSKCPPRGTTIRLSATNSPSAVPAPEAGSGSCPEVGFEEIAIDLFQSRFAGLTQKFNSGLSVEMKRAMSIRHSSIMKFSMTASLFPFPVGIALPEFSLEQFAGGGVRQFLHPYKRFG